jgi:hypothetical protein
LIVFAQPIGHDTIYNFDTAHDQIDLIGYAGYMTFVDVQAHTINADLGNAVITLGDGQTITLQVASTLDRLTRATSCSTKPRSRRTPATW